MFGERMHIFCDFEDGVAIEVGLDEVEFFDRKSDESAYSIKNASFFQLSET